MSVDLHATIVIDASACDATAFDVDMQFFLVDRPKARMHVDEQLYNRREDHLTLDEVVKINIRG